MANTTSNVMARRFTDPVTVSPVRQNHGRVRTKICTFTIDISADGAGHIYRLFRVKANDAPLSLAISNDGAAAGVNDTNWGIRTISDASGTDPAQIAAAQDSCFADAYDMSAASAGWTEILGTGAAAASLETNAGMEVWEYAGITSEPAAGTEYEAVMVCVGDPITADEVVAVKFTYIAGD
jgi:hypothetical protein